MKKIITFILLISFSLPAFAEYVPIPEEKQAQYKLEVEQYIDKQVLVAEKQIKKEVKIAEKIYKQYFHDKKGLLKKEEYLEKLNNCFTNANFYQSYIYIDLINITKKYADIESLIPATSFVQELDLFISPYLKQSNIKNINKINDLYNISSRADKKILYFINLISTY